MGTSSQHELACDVLVAGGGMAGICCAIAAARNGARVILCQDRSVLGGNASSEIRMHIVGANGTGSFDRGEPLRTEPREGGIIEEIRLETAARNSQRSPSMFDLILHEKCRAERNLTLMLNTIVHGVEMRADQIQRVIADRHGTEDRFRIRASVFVDCTGDGRLGAEAGAASMEGRESRGAFQESLAPETADSRRLGSTILMMARRHDRPMPFAAPSWARTFSRDQLALRLYADPGEERPSLEYGFWWAEWGGTLDTIRDNEQIRDQLLAIVMGIWDHVKNGPPGTTDWEDPWDASHWALDWFGFVPGKRESRRFIGQHVLTERDLLGARRFQDAIAFGGWALDLHPPEGVDAPQAEPCRQQAVPCLYEIPLSSCVSRDIPNLMFAGRNISATHVAFSSTRVMATCAVVGQGVGTAAACSVARGILPAELRNQPELLRAIEQQLLRDDAYLIGHVNQDPADIARTARVSASSETADGPADLVLSGQTRCVHGSRGAPIEHRYPGMHRWMSDPVDGLPAWIQLAWDKPVSVRTIQLIFDTGLHRHLTLSHLDSYTAQMCWGRPQPETVRDYTVELLSGDQWHCLAKVRGNYQRLRLHRLDRPLPGTAVRITVFVTNGLDHARICEIRAYG